MSFFLVKDSFAAQFSQARVRYDRMKVTSPTSLQILIVPSSASITGTEAKLKINFGGLTPGAVPTTSVTSLPSGAIALPGTLTAAGLGTSIVISGVTNLTAGTTYVVNIDTGVSTPGAANQYFDTVETQDSGNVRIDATVVATRVITDDQLVLIGNVPPSFNFVLSGNSDTFPDLVPGSVVSTLGRTVTVSTNATRGWTGWVKSLNIGLSSATTIDTIGTSGVVDVNPSSCATGDRNCYVLDADKTTTGAGLGTLTIDPEYNGTDTNSGGTLSNQFQPFVTRTGKATGDVITLIARVAIGTTTASASDYSDTLTVIGAGNF